jgi:hypothetical protein
VSRGTGAAQGADGHRDRPRTTAYRARPITLRVVSSGQRNVLIVLAIAAAVVLVPGGGRTAGFANAVIGIAISTAFALIGARLYRENRITIFSLGDRHRGLLYGAIAVAVLAMAARPRLWETGAGTLAWLVLVGGASLALVQVWRHYRAYG